MKIIVLLSVFVFVMANLWSRTVHAGDIPQKGQYAPAFELFDQSGKLQKLMDFRGKWLVLYFYPKDETPNCTTEACHFRDDISKIHALGAEVMGVSIDDASSHAEFAKKHHLSFPLLADKNGAVAARYGSISDWMVLKIAKRNTFLIDPEGKIAKVYLSVNAESHANQLISDLISLQRGQH